MNGTSISLVVTHGGLGYPPNTTERLVVSGDGGCPGGTYTVDGSGIVSSVLLEATDCTTNPQTAAYATTTAVMEVTVVGSAVEVSVTHGGLGYSPGSIVFAHDTTNPCATLPVATYTVSGDGLGTYVTMMSVVDV